MVRIEKILKMTFTQILKNSKITPTNYLKLEIKKNQFHVKRPQIKKLEKK